MHNAELHPPDVQRPQAVNARGGEWRAVVGTDRVRQSDLAEQGPEDQLGVHRPHGAQPATGEYAAAEVIGHGEG